MNFWLEIKLLAIGVLLGCGIFLYQGWYMWNFKRPPTAQYTQQFINGTNATVTQNAQETIKQKLNGLNIGYGTDKVITFGYTRFF
jgi:predicted negative regulator of RcsB-dependent stress response